MDFSARSRLFQGRLSRESSIKPEKIPHARQRVKIIIFTVLALILAVAGTVVYVLTDLNSIVKAALEKYG
jgi:hypothetical protein